MSQAAGQAQVAKLVQSQDIQSFHVILPSNLLEEINALKPYYLILAIPLTASLVVSASSTPKAHHTPKKTTSKKATSQTPPLKNGLTSAQTVAIQAALKSLRKLEAATEVGVSQVDYQSRLIDTKADVDEDLRGIPDSNPAGNHIRKCLEAYQDASNAWNDKEDFHYWSVFKDSQLAAPIVVRKYNIATKFEDPDIQVADKDELADYAHSVITKACWQVAHAEYDKAEESLK